jgi:hypothetical protein
MAGIAYVLVMSPILLPGEPTVVGGGKDGSSDGTQFQFD